MKRLKKKIGFFGGTFDPIHNGHLHLALSLLEKKKLDAVLFCPAALSPFKRGAPPKASPEDRLEMIRLALEPIEQFELIDWEIRQKTVSYTIDTLRFLIERNAKEDSSVRYRLILGEDALSDFSKWKESELLLRMAPPLVGSRLKKTSRKPDGIEFIHLPLLEISSTDIRKRLKEGKYCGHLLPFKVLNYIQKHNLYTR